MKRVNELLCMTCVAEDFIFMDHSEITMKHISADGLHPNHYGIAILKYNILSVFDTFDSSHMDFKEDYQRAISIY